MRAKRGSKIRHIGPAAVAIVVTAVLTVWAHRPAIAAIAPSEPRDFTGTEIARGQGLARIGGCVSCHRSAHGRPYAGGFGVHSPFGTIYGSNITIVG